jgi:hypothetical protein
LTVRSSQKETTSSGDASTAAEQRDVETATYDFSGLLEMMPSWLVSTLVHVTLILFLAIFTIARASEKSLTLSVEPNDQAEVFTEMEVVDYEEVEFEEDSSMEEMVYSENELSLPAVNSTVANTLADSFESMDLDVGLGELVEGLEELGEEVGTTTFFGAKQTAQKVVFVVDNSNSMTKGKFETALNELSKTVGNLTPKQKFHVIFFSDTAYMMFHPKPVTKLLPATEENKDRLRQWLYTVELCLKTKGAEAMNAALMLKPDVIYVLGDGAFTDNTKALLTAPHRRKIIVNTLGMQVSGKGSEQLKSIARSNRGKYRDVSPAAGSAQMARQNPIRRNKSRGKVWGITLPVVAKK